MHWFIFFIFMYVCRNLRTMHLYHIPFHIAPVFIFCSALTVLQFLHCISKVWFDPIWFGEVEKWNVSVNNKLSEHWTRRDSVEVDVYCKKYILVKSRRLLSSSVWHKKKSWRSRREEYVFKINVKNLESCETAHMFLDARAPRSSSGRRTFFCRFQRQEWTF